MIVVVILNIDVILLFIMCSLLYYVSGDVSIGVSSAEIKIEADSNITECSDDRPSSGMFAVSDDIISAFIRLCNVHIIVNHVRDVRIIIPTTRG